MGDYLGNSRPPVHKTMIMTTPGKVETVDWSNAPIGLEPPGIPVDKSPVVNVYLDDTPYQPEKEYQIKSGDEIIMTPPLIAYDLPASFDKMNHALKHGFKPGEMQVISSLKPGKSMLGAYAAAVKNLPKTMMELRSPQNHQITAGRQTGKSLLFASYFELYTRNALKIVNRYEKLKADRKTNRFKKRQHRK